MSCLGRTVWLTLLDGNEIRGFVVNERLGCLWVCPEGNELLPIPVPLKSVRSMHVEPWKPMSYREALA